MTAECERVKEDRERRRQEFGPARETLEITRAHRVCRCIVERHIDHEMNKPRPSAFDQAGMSVFVEGPGFPEVNWDEVLSTKKEWIAVAAIDVAEFLDNETVYNFELLHDPFSDEHGNQHDNHALIVCKKNPTKGTRMQRTCIWRIPPGAHQSQASSKLEIGSTGSTDLAGIAQSIEAHHRETSKRAYELWVAGGCRHGQDLNDWFEAEGQLG